jgi:hypothetical protein
MKNILYYTAIISCMLAMLTACKKMDSTYKQFVVTDGIVYPGKANKPVANAGRNRVKNFLAERRRSYAGICKNFLE